MGQQIGTRLACDGRVRNVGDGDRLRSPRQSLSLGGNRVRCFTGLGDYHNNGIGAGMRRPVTIFAGILNIHRNPGEILNHDFARQAGMATGSTGGDDDFLEGLQSTLDGLKFAGKN